MKRLSRVLSIILIGAMLLSSCSRVPEDPGILPLPTVPAGLQTEIPEIPSENDADGNEVSPDEGAETQTEIPAEDIYREIYRDYLGPDAETLLNPDGEGTAKEDTSDEPAREEQPSDAQKQDEAGSQDGGEYSRALAKKNQTYDRNASRIETDAQNFPAQKDYTLMIYMIGSNLESGQGSATRDIQEMLEASLDFSRINLILYTGGAARWNTDIPCDRNCVVDLSRDEQDWVVASTEKNADMGAPDTLSAFVNFTTEHYPADRYAMIFWDHGGGPLFGYGSDELFGGDGLLLTELYEAMKDTAFATQGKLDFVGFDACLMGSLESMSVWSGFARYYVGSEELEPGDGWDYRFLSALNESYEPETVTQAIVDSFREYYEAKRSDYYDPDLTLSVADLSKLAAVHTALSSAALEMTDVLSRDGLYVITQDRQDTKSYGAVGSSEDGSQYSYDLMDLKHFASTSSALSDSVRKKLTEAVDSLIIFQYSNVEHAGGVTVYYPFSNPTQFFEMRLAYQEMGVNRDYSQFLSELSRAQNQERETDFVLPEIVRDGADLTLSFSEDQVQEIRSVTYSVITQMSEGTYYPYLKRCTVPIGEDGTVRLSEDPELIALTTGGRSIAWEAVQVDRTASRAVYQTMDTRLCSTGTPTYFRMNLEFTDITAVLSRDLATGDMSIRTINTLAEEAAFSGKETVDVSHYDSIYNYRHELIPVWNDKNELLPIDDWKEGPLSGNTSCVIDSSFGFGTIRASELQSDLYYLVTVEDIYGKQYTAGPVKIEPERIFREKEVRTENGILTYLIYEDHAVVSSYEGRDASVTVPSSVDGVPVTEIGANAFAVRVLFQEGGSNPTEAVILPDTIEVIDSAAFMYCSLLKEINIPKNVKTIGARAFEGCAVPEITVPEGVTSIGPYAFADSSALTVLRLPSTLESLGKGFAGLCKNLERIEFSGNCAAYKAVDGAVYTADGTCLLACPAARTGSFAVADGTETIDSDAFSCSALTSVTLPEGLRSIGNYAFYMAKDLEMPALPESLESVGKYAFCAGWYNLRIPGDTAVQSVIRLGSGVSYIGCEAFSGYAMRTFEVSPDNPRFSAKKGNLMNKAGDSLVEFAASGALHFVIPEGCVNFELDIMQQISQYDSIYSNSRFHIYVPSSVIRILTSGRSTFWKDMVIHCEKGSYAEERARLLGLEISYEYEPVLSVVSGKAEDGTMIYWLYEDHAAWTHYEGTAVSLRVPDSVQGLPVTALGDGTVCVEGGDWSKEKTLTKIVLPDTVEVIRDFAFNGMKIESMGLPVSVRVIGREALDCGSLDVKKLPPRLEALGYGALGYGTRFTDGVDLPATLRSIEPGAFRNNAVSEFRMKEGTDYCRIIGGMLYSGDGTILMAGTKGSRDMDLTIPDGVKVIGAHAFEGCDYRSLILPDSMMLIGQNAFTSSYGLKEVRWNAGLTVIGDGAFCYCGGLTEAVLPESLVKIGEKAFHSCSKMTRAEVHAQIIGKDAFSYSEALSDVTLCEGILVIGDTAFFHTPFSHIVLPESLTAVGERAFGSYPNLVQERLGGTEDVREYVLKIGKNLRSIGQGAFASLPVTAFEVDPENPAYRSVEGMLTDRTGKTLLACPSGRKGKVTVPDGVYQLANYSFSGCSLITDLYVPGSVMTVDSLAVDTSLVRSGDMAAYTIHAPADSAAAQRARNWQFPLSEWP